MKNEIKNLMIEIMVFDIPGCLFIILGIVFQLETGANIGTVLPTIGTLLINIGSCVSRLEKVLELVYYKNSLQKP